MACLILILCSLCWVSNGCYDSEQLIAAAKAHAADTSLEDVDLGFYTISMPRESNRSTIVQVEMEIFATIPYRDAKKVREAFEANKPKLRNSIIIDVRSSNMKIFTESDLASLKKQLGTIIHGLFAVIPVDSIGINNLRLSEI